MNLLDPIGLSHKRMLSKVVIDLMRRDIMVPMSGILFIHVDSEGKSVALIFDNNSFMNYLDSQVQRESNQEKSKMLCDILDLLEARMMNHDDAPISIVWEINAEEKNRWTMFQLSDDNQASIEVNVESDKYTSSSPISGSPRSLN